MNKIILSIFLGCTLALAKDLRQNDQSIMSQDWFPGTGNDIYNWKVNMMYFNLDNIELDSVAVYFGGFSVFIHKTHLRGFHKLHTISDESPVVDGKWQATLTFDDLELRTTVHMHDDGFPNNELRVYSAMWNLKLRGTFERGEHGYPVVTSLDQIVGEPEWDYVIKENDSVFKSVSVNHQKAVADVKDYVKNVIFRQALSKLFSKQNLATISASAHYLSSKLQGKIGISEIANWDADYWTIIARNTFLCDHYYMEENVERSFRINVNGEIKTGTIYARGGDLKDVDYYKRDLCLGPMCRALESEGKFAFKFDEMYSKYEIEVDYNGQMYKANMTIVSSNHVTEEDYEMRQFCMVGCVTAPYVTDRKILYKGEPHIDVIGLPEELHFLEYEFDHMGIQMRDRMLTKMAQIGLNDRYPSCTNNGQHRGMATLLSRHLQ